MKNIIKRKYIYLDSSSSKYKIDSNSICSSDSDEGEGTPGTKKSDLYDKIIFRTCINKNDKIFQISMSLVKSPKDHDILVFLIRHGSATENTQKFSIDVKTLCEKTGLSKKNIVPLGNYFVKHMLVLGENDVSYIDFTKEKMNYLENIIRVQAMIRGILVRKSLNKYMKKLVFKKKVRIDGLKWALLLFLGMKQFSLRMVKGTEVVGVELDMMLATRDDNDTNFQNLVMKIIIPNIHMVKEDGIYKIIGLDKYYC